MAENFPNVRKETEIQVHETQTVPNEMKPNRPTPRHVTIKMVQFKDKDRILKAARDKNRVSHKRTSMRLSADFSAEALQARREWHDIFKVLKGKALQPRLLYPARLSFRREREIKNVLDKQKPKEFSNTKPTLKEMLKGLL